MNVQRRTDTQLVLRESPALPLLIGGIFWVGGLYVLVRERETLIAIVFAIVVGLIVAAFATSTVCEFDRSKGLVTREIKGLLRRSRIQHPLSHIVGLRIERSAAQRSQAFRVVLVLSTGERVPLTTGFTSGKGDKEETAALIRDFLQLNDVGDVPIPGVVDMVRMMMDPDAVERLAATYGPDAAVHLEAVQADPDNVEARRQLATALAMQNRPEEARVHLEHARDVLLRRGDQKLAGQYQEMLERMEAAARHRR